MVLTDKIYGKFKINEPVLKSFLKTPAILRLKNISTFGIPDKYYHCKGHSRYEHSVGVMLLLRKLGASLEEQLAGLLHDVSTPAFSHVADWVFAGGMKGNEDYHDKLHENFVKITEIPELLEKYNFSIERILRQNNFHLLEREIPDLCADRIDYSARQLKFYLNEQEIASCVESLTNFNGKIIFLNTNAAFKFAHTFLILQTEFWGGEETSKRYYLFAQMLKRALKIKILKKKDFFKDEKYIMEIINKSKDTEVVKSLKILSEKAIPIFEVKKTTKVFKKFRYVDPKVLKNGKLIRLSRLIPMFGKIINEHRRINKEGITIQ